ncbi:unnamed protein product [Prorocentrum cordatum]|uniref:Uncharacterized protein n=1 Tax=Prorocentrum cordatum TaxID=2364126 RepID=A0ABN9RLI8_9DINO|nr:unnamed protein product [Polarella glacialis]
MPRLQELQADFLQFFPGHDVAGLWHHRWEILAGKGPGAANAPEALSAARQYKASLDAEKGGPRPPRPARGWDAKWDFMSTPGKRARDSPTVAGGVFRVAAQGLEALHRRDSAASEGADSDLRDAWLRKTLGEGMRRHLIELAGKARGKWLERIRSDRRRDDRDDADSNYSSGRPRETDAVFDSFLEQLLAECRQEAERVGASLEDLALAAWWQKYVEQGVGTKCSDPDKTWPWALFLNELVGAKERVAPCSLHAAERCRRHLRCLLAAARHLLSHDSEQSRSEYLGRLQRAREEPRCRGCAAQLHRRLEDLGMAGSGDPGPERVVEALGEAARSRQASRISASALRYCRGEISRTFRNGKQAGVPLESLASRLASGDESPLKDLKLTAVVYHGKHFVVEGNCRLWCLKEAARRMGRDLEVQVEVVDLHLGFVRQQDAGQPAPRAFFQRFSTKTDGESVDWDGDDGRAGPDGTSRAPEGGAPPLAEPGGPLPASAASPPGTSTGEGAARARGGQEERGFDDAFRGLGGRQLVEAKFSELCGLHHPANGGGPEDYQRLQHAYDRALARASAAPVSVQPTPPSRRQLTAASAQGRAVGSSRGRCIKASFPQRCMQCSGQIEVGSSIRKAGPGWCHDECVQYSP